MKIFIFFEDEADGSYNVTGVVKPTVEEAFAVFADRMRKPRRLENKSYTISLSAIDRKVTEKVTFMGTTVVTTYSIDEHDVGEDGIFEIS